MFFRFFHFFPDFFRFLMIPIFVDDFFCDFVFDEFFVFFDQIFSPFFPNFLDFSAIFGFFDNVMQRFLCNAAIQEITEIGNITLRNQSKKVG